MLNIFYGYAERVREVLKIIFLLSEPDLRLIMKIELINSAGMLEAGIDGGGLLREFLSELLKTCFDPIRGFFCLTADNYLYPNPGVAAVNPDFLDHYFFIGRMLGKVSFRTP